MFITGMISSVKKKEPCKFLLEAMYITGNIISSGHQDCLVIQGKFICKKRMLTGNRLH